MIAKKANSIPFIYEGLLIGLMSFVCLFGGTELVYRAYAVRLPVLLLSGIFLLLLLLKAEKDFYYPSAAVFLVIFLAVVLLQCVPLPMGVIRAVSAKTALLYEKFLPEGSQIQWRTLSVYVFVTQEKLVDLIALLAVFFVTINIVKTKQQLQRVVAFSIAVAVLLSFYAAAKGYFLPHKTLAGFGSFSNRNYYAGFTLLITFLCIGYAFSLKELPKRILFLFLSGLLAAGVIISVSRAAIMSLFFWLCIMVVWFMQQKLFTKERVITFILLLAMLMIFYFVIVNPEPLLAKLEKTKSSFAGRLAKYNAAFSVAKDFPLFGVGLGNYGYVSTQYSKFGIAKPDPYVHSDPLQLIAETGIGGSVLFLLFFVFLLIDIISQLYKRRDPFMRCITIGGLCGVFALATHSFLEVLFAVPAIAFMFWFIMAVIYKAVYIHAERPQG